MSLSRSSKDPSFSALFGISASCGQMAMDAALLDATYIALQAPHGMFTPVLDTQGDRRVLTLTHKHPVVQGAARFHQIAIAQEGGRFAVHETSTLEAAGLEAARPLGERCYTIAGGQIWHTMQRWATDVSAPIGARPGFAPRWA